MLKKALPKSAAKKVANAAAKAAVKAATKAVAEELFSRKSDSNSSNGHAACLEKGQGRGDILVSLCYQPAANIVTTVVLKARNLPKMDMNGFSGKCRQLLLNAKLSLQFPAFLFSDPYVKIYMLCNEQRVTKKKTHVKKRTLNPVFNESFVFDLPQHPEGGSGNSIKNVSFEFWLFDWDRGTKDEVRN